MWLRPNIALLPAALPRWQLEVWIRSRCSSLVSMEGFYSVTHFEGFSCGIAPTSVYATLIILGIGCSFSPIDWPVMPMSRDGSWRTYSSSSFPAPPHASHAIDPWPLQHLHARFPDPPQRSTACQIHPRQSWQRLSMTLGLNGRRRMQSLTSFTLPAGRLTR